MTAAGAGSFYGLARAEVANYSGKRVFSYVVDLRLGFVFSSPVITRTDFGKPMRQREESVSMTLTICLHMDPCK